MSNRRELLGPQHASLAQLEFRDQLFATIHEFLHLPFEPAEVAFPRENNFREVGTDLASRVLQANLEAADGSAEAARHSVTENQAGDSTQHADTAHAPCQPTHRSVMVFVGTVHFLFVGVEELLAVSPRVRFEERGSLFKAFVPVAARHLNLFPFFAIVRVTGAKVFNQFAILSSTRSGSGLSIWRRIWRFGRGVLGSVSG